MSFTMSSNEEIRRQAEACGGEYYTASYDTVENPLNIDEVEDLIKEIQVEFADLARRHPDKLDKDLQQLYRDQHKDNDKKSRFLNRTHKTIADALMKRYVPSEMRDAILYMLKVKKTELSTDHTEAEKDKAVETMQNRLFNSCLREEK